MAHYAAILRVYKAIFCTIGYLLATTPPFVLAALLVFGAALPGAEVVDPCKGNEGFHGSGGLESGPPGPDFEGFRAKAEG